MESEVWIQGLWGKKKKQKQNKTKQNKTPSYLPVNDAIMSYLALNVDELWLWRMIIVQHDINQEAPYEHTEKGS